MNKLLRVPKVIWMSIVLVFSLSVLTVIYILNYNIESSYSTTAVASSGHNSSVFVDSKGAYLLNKYSYVTIAINDQYVKARVTRIEYHKDDDIFEITLSGLENVDLIPNTKVPVRIIYKNDKVIHTLLNPGV